MQRETARMIYVSRRDGFAAHANRLANKSNRVSNLRLLAASITLFCLALTIWGDTAFRTALATVSLLGAVGFAALVVHHRRVTELQVRFAELAAINAESLARMDRDWNRVSLPAEPADLGAAPFAQDLDLVGSPGTELEFAL